MIPLNGIVGSQVNIGCFWINAGWVKGRNMVKTESSEETKRIGSKGMVLDNFTTSV